MAAENKELQNIIDNKLTAETEEYEGRRKYTRADVIESLAIYHLTHSAAEVERHTGVPRKIVNNWIVKARDTNLLNEVNEYAKEWKEHTQADLRVLANAALSQAYNTIEEASPLQAAQIAQIAMEQIRKIEGNAEQMTQNNFFFTNNTLSSYDDDEKIALMERVAARHNRQKEA